jgi:hypothetical protein
MHVHLLDAPCIPPRIQVMLYDALEALRCLETNLALAHDKFEGNAEEKDYRPDSFTYLQYHAVVGLHIAVIQELIGGVLPTIPAARFKAIMDHKNIHDENPPHTEATMMAAIIAKQKLEEATNALADDDDASDEAWGVAAAALLSVGTVYGDFDSTMSMTYAEESLDFILAGKPVPTCKEFRRAWINKRFPSGFYDKAHTQPTWDHVTDEPLYASR